jgi:hypothetical protein
MFEDTIISWLLDADVSIQYQVNRDLLDEDRPDLQAKILEEGWGKAFLKLRKKNKHWGLSFYQPKWISSHYTLLDIKNLNPLQDHPLLCESIDQIADHEKGHDGGINPSGSVNQSDVCINGMFLNYASYFRTSEKRLHSVVDFVLSQQLADGGFNCRYNRSGAKHSSLHSTLSVCEGFREYIRNNYLYRKDEILKAEQEAQEFILMHQLYISDRTGEIIHPAFLKLSYPGRWRYDILRALNYFRIAKHPYDERMQPALDVLMKKRRKDGTWPVQAKHPGKTHFDYEKTGKASRWNTLRALRVLNYFIIGC